MWVIDIRNWLDNVTTGPAEPKLKFKVKKLGEIITYATSEAAGNPLDETPKCWRRPKRKPCNGNLDIRIDLSVERIYWKCGSCGDEGTVTGWKGLRWDAKKHPEILD